VNFHGFSHKENSPEKECGGKSGLGFIFDERDNKNILLFIITIHCCPETFSQNSYY